MRPSQPVSPRSRWSVTRPDRLLSRRVDAGLTVVVVLDMARFSRTRVHAASAGFRHPTIQRNVCFIHESRLRHGSLEWGNVRAEELVIVLMRGFALEGLIRKRPAFFGRSGVRFSGHILTAAQPVRAQTR